MTNTTEQTWCLLKASDGQRGDNGKQKVYEVRVTQDANGWLVTMSWGMAEKVARQTKTMRFWSAGAATQTAVSKVQDKVSTGYRVAYTA